MLTKKLRLKTPPSNLVKIGAYRKILGSVGKPPPKPAPDLSTEMVDWIRNLF